jgi:pimeloyl-ACP methyl ester carboxylesterase
MHTTTERPLVIRHLFGGGRAAGILLKTVTVALGALAFASPEQVLAQSAKPTVVLIHGAWADASSWDGVIKALRTDGYPVFAPPNPLRGVASDAASITAFLKTIPGPIILVGHSYGGTIISAASAGNSKVKALVFVDAFVPEGGESCLSLLASAPPPPKDLFVPVPFATAGGGDADLYLSPKYYGAVFASDVPAPIAAVMAITQRPIANSALNEKSPEAEGWKTIPSWYVVGDEDHVLPPAIQLFMANRAKAHISHVHGGHPSMIEHPGATVEAIVAAANGTK